LGVKSALVAADPDLNYEPSDAEGFGAFSRIRDCYDSDITQFLEMLLPQIAADYGYRQPSLPYLRSRWAFLQYA
jgi:hypothetical protein